MTTAKPKTHQTYQPHLGPENNKSRTQINRQSQLPDPCPSAITFYIIHNELYTAKKLNSKLLPISLIKVLKMKDKHQNVHYFAEEKSINASKEIMKKEERRKMFSV